MQWYMLRLNEPEWPAKWALKLSLMPVCNYKVTDDPRHNNQMDNCPASSALRAAQGVSPPTEGLRFKRKSCLVTQPIPLRTLFTTLFRNVQQNSTHSRLHCSRPASRLPITKAADKWTLHYFFNNYITYYYITYLLITYYLLLHYFFNNNTQATPIHTQATPIHI